MPNCVPFKYKLLLVPLITKIHCLTELLAVIVEAIVLDVGEPQFIVVELGIYAKYPLDAL